MRRSRMVRRGAGAAALAATAVALVWLLLSGGGDDDGEDPAPAAGAAAAAPQGRGEPREAEAPAAESELVEGLMLVGFEGDDSRAALRELEGHAYGGVLVGPGNWPGGRAGEDLVGELRDALGEGGPAPLIATRQEGGPYRSLSDLPPSLREIEVGDRGSARLAGEWGEEGARALARAGFDLNLAPVADVATLDSPIADRAFSDDADVAAEMTAAAVRGCERGGVACAVSHFPGLGAASQDTDAGPAAVGLDAATLASRDLLPFRAAFDAGAPAVVVSLGLYSAYDPVSPASLAPEVAGSLLRDELGFEGVAISDDIGAGAIEAVSDPGAAAVAAVDAGIDLVQVADPRDVERVRAALGAALAEGELDRERVDEALARIEALRDGEAG